MAGIWVNFANLQDILGKDMATVLCQARGGVSFYVPKTAPAGHDLVRVIGMAGFRALAAVYGGEVIVVPNYRRGTPRKGTILKLLEQGVSMRDIAMRLDVTERYVEYIAACVRPKHAQRSLLEYSAPGVVTQETTHGDSNKGTRTVSQRNCCRYP